jgi:hypothetical protein
MDCWKIAARMATAASVVAIAAPVASNAESTTPTYVGMTPQDVGVLDRARPAYDAKGIPLGGFRLFPALTASASYDDNIFRTVAPQSDWFFTTSPTVRLKSQWGRHFFELYSGLNSYNYSKYNDEDLVDWNVGTDGRIDISRAANVTANVYYSELHELWSAPNNVVGFQAKPNRYRQTHADTVGIYQPNRLGFSLGTSFDHYSWASTPAIGGGWLYNGDRDQNEYQAFFKTFYDFSPGYSAFVKASYDERDFEDAFDRSGLRRSSHGYRVDGGMDLQISHLVSGEIFIGYLQQSFAHNGVHSLKDVSGFDYGAQLDWYVSPMLTLHLSGARRLDDVVLTGVSVVDNKSVTASADYELLPNVILQARGGYVDSKYVGSDRSDQYPMVGVGVKYLMNRYVGLDAGYTYSERSTNSSSLHYSDNTVNIGLTLHI